MAEADAEASERQAKRASAASLTPSLPKSRPHSAAELYYPASQGFQNFSSERLGSAQGERPRIIDASKYGVNVEDEPDYRGSSRGKNRASYTSTSGGSMSSWQDRQDRPPRSRRSSRQPIQDEFTLIEDPVENLTEISAKPPAHVQDDVDDRQSDRLRPGQDS
ncbi:MAG: hypothetical protein INR71_14670, partial [Terriglobus roseus]|nr:hypothetical protein [Terriglobus roseus]